MGHERTVGHAYSNLVALTRGAGIGASRSASGVATSAIEGVTALRERFENEGFARAFDDLVGRILSVRGRVIIAGMGKSGIIARKIVATLTSSGTPASYLHPAEAGHGDLGMITSDDFVLVFTQSGETTELGSIFRYCKRFRIPNCVVTANGHSTAARAADVCLQLPTVREACPIDLAPTTSTTVQLVFGDALAIALMQRRGFSAEEFHTYHPAGRLGAQLLRVREVMAAGRDVPKVMLDTPLIDATIEMTRARLGGTAVVDARGRLVGAFTDGDLRRTVTGGDALTGTVGDHMSAAPIRIKPDELASSALRIMQEKNVLLLFVCEGDRLVGAIHMHDLLRAGVI